MQIRTLSEMFEDGTVDRELKVLAATLKNKGIENIATADEYETATNSLNSIFADRHGVAVSDDDIDDLIMRLQDFMLQ